ncbi:MAG: TolC family outer membrane protein [Burkholderiaceae bacterium]|nr:TolC family outer membrane protein [Burkholderiaceae bacterium]
MKESAQLAITTNPEVQAKWHAFQAANGERDVAFGGYLPHADLQASVAHESHNEPLLVDNFNSRSEALTLTQMLYDGFATANDVARLDHNRLARLYELYDTSESTTLEVVRAHLDVLRYRKLVALAEENYVQHRAVYDQIQSKAKAGVGRRVDLEQSAGRLALAEANLLTETSNLHDVSARFQRLVGVRPAKDLDEPLGLENGLPPDIGGALRFADKTHPAVLAAIESIRAADSEASTRRAAYQPRLDLRLNAQHGNNINSEIGVTNDRTAQIVMTWNLFNGLSDRARLHQLADQINVTRDLRDKVCRDLRQNLEIAYNDKRKIAELLTYLDQHQLSIEKARDAYKQQFDIGQRTLLDLLDTENELFQARRSFVEAQYDQLIAYARAQAGMGNLFKVLGLTRPDAGPLPNFGDRTDETDANNCPVEAPETYVADKSDLNIRAVELLKESASAAENIRSATVSRDAAAQVSAPNNPNNPHKLVADALMAWSAAWSSHDLQAYLNFYSPTFQPSATISREQWAAGRRAKISASRQISVGLTNVKFTFQDASHATATFHQSYRGDAYRDEVEKVLEWENIGGHWVITAESSKP